MRSAQHFVIDSNVLITPASKFYAFCYTSAFWETMGELIDESCIVVIDKVYKEIKKQDDELKKWLSVRKALVKSTATNEIFSEWGKILDHLSKDQRYMPAAVNKWAQDTVADPYVIAAAKVWDYTVVSVETRQGQPGKGQQWGAAKIPNVCDELGCL